MPNKYEKVAEAGKIMPNKYQALAEPFKLMDKAIEDFNKSTDSMFSEITYVSRLEQEITQLKDIVKGYRFETATLKEENFQLKEELEKAEDALITSINENTKLKEKLKFKNLPLNKRIEEEYITRRENEDKQKKEVL